MKVTDLSEGDLKVGLCGGCRFKERYHLKKHVLFKHTDELREECRVCGKRFKDSTAVRAHERTHSDARPYACPRCDKTFKTSECLWHHENRSKTCGKSLGELPLTSRPAVGTRARRGRHRRSDRGLSHLPQLQAHHMFRHEPSKIDVEAVIARETRNHHLQHSHQQQSAIYIGSVSPSAQFVEMTAVGSPDQSENGSADDLLRPHHGQEDLICVSSSAQFAELAPTGAHHTASPDQPESGFVNFDCGAIDWDMASGRPDSTHPVVKVEAAEMMDLLDYNLAAFNPPSDSLSSYPDVFDKMKIDIVGSADGLYDDDDDDEDDVDDDIIGLDFKQSQQPLLMHNVADHSVRAILVSLVFYYILYSLI